MILVANLAAKQAIPSNTVRLLPFIPFCFVHNIPIFLCSLFKAFSKWGILSCARISCPNFCILRYIRTGEQFETFHIVEYKFNSNFKTNNEN